MSSDGLWIGMSPGAADQPFQTLQLLGDVFHTFNRALCHFKEIGRVRNGFG